MNRDAGHHDIYTEVDQDNVAWLHFAKHGSSTNVLSASVLEDFYKELLDLAERAPRGLVILSDKSNGFIAGADVREFTRLENRDQALEAIQRGQEVFDRLAALPFPTVALIHGFCLGGGLELALACRYRVSRDDPSTRLGLPEVKLGIHPGFGGSARLTHLVGAVHAMDLMLSGRTVDGRTAARMGFVDHVVPERHLKTAARALILQPGSAHRASKLQTMSNHAWVRPGLARLFEHRVARKASRDHYPAPYALIELWQQHADQQRSMMHAEAESVAKLIVGPTAQNLIRVFLLQEQLKALGRGSDYKARHVHVVGAGLMGGDIAAWCALRGLRVTLQDQSAERIAPAIKRASQLFSRRLKRPRPIQEAMDRLAPDPKGVGIGTADVVIEAIFEDAEAKRSLYAMLEPRMRDDAILATNTSSIPLAELRTALRTPSRLVGLHFFNPVAKMQLVEIVRDENTDPDVVARALAFTGLIDRLPLPVSSTPGFLVNRILLPYLLEAVELESEGVPSPEIDRQALQFGMPLGPLELADTVGLDICLHVAEILGRHFAVAVPQRLRALVAQGRLGRKSGRGFYRYRKGEPVKTSLPKGYHSNPDILDRLLLRMLNETVACLRENVVGSADHLDAGMVYGTGFAPFRGGPLHYIETTGADVILQRLHELEQQFGERFRPDPGWESVSGFTNSGIRK
ncbi:MAG: enoyl-CoA hydratase/isomerase family protein [Thiogranum sp.]|nr:enoyl-CoA hydratase/isomerase family protein [Thiogranum sp.]